MSMGGGGYMSTGTALSGDIVGGIGGLIASQNYQRPVLPTPGPAEDALRRLAMTQLLGGGQQLLGATALYNQLAPILMGQLPGMHYVPGGAGADASMPGTGAATASPMANYQQSLAAMRANQGLQSQLQSLRGQRRALRPGPSPQRRDLRQQIQTVNRTLKQQPKPWQLERQQYLAGTMGSQNPAMFNVQQGAPATAPTSDTLDAIRQLMSAYSSSSGPDLSNLYQQQIGGGGQL